MTSNLLRGFTGLAALVAVTLSVSTASAFCSTCGGGGAAYYAPSNYTASYAPAYTTAYAPAYTTAYAPAYTTGYAPVTYTANYGSGGWFPGCCLGRLFGWGSQPTYAVSYAPAYPVSYAPACSSCSSCAPCSTCSSCTAGYAPCSSCASSPCTSCAQQVTMRPVCSSACAPSCGCSDGGSSCSSCGSDGSCSGCSSCGGAAVSQAVYQESSGCSSCGQAVVAAPAATAVVVPGGQQMMVVPAPANAGQQAAPSGGPAPEVAPSEQVPPRTFQKPPTDNGELQPAPATGTAPAQTAPSNGADPAEGALKGNSNANYFEAPKLFNPSDRSAARVAAPVRNALYEKPVSYYRVSTGPITAAQAQQDAAGWTSASK